MIKAYIKKAAFIAHTIKVSLAMVIPILFIGSFTVMLNSFPILSYQEFLDTFLDGALRNIISVIQSTTVGILAIYITVALNISYTSQTEKNHRLVFGFGSLIACLNGFAILIGMYTKDPDLSMLSGQGVFSAMVAGIVGSILFRKFESMFKVNRMVFVDGADSEFNAALHVVLPFLCVSLCFAAANYLITVCFDVQSVQHLFMKAVDAIFIKMQRSYSSGLLFTSLTSVLWWFGIHGNNVLNQVAEDLFTAIIPGQIVSKSFIDTFVNMGGTGCSIGLLIAMLAFGRRSSTRKLSRMAFLPGMFNISELLVFGFPVIYNPILIIPFILAPILCYTNAYILTQIGFMPQVTESVVWTVPALMSGYLATGSVRGVMVQIINIVIATACYSPFVIMYERRSLNEFASSMDVLLDVFMKSEENSQNVELIECEGNVGRFAKHMAMDLETSLSLYIKDIDSDKADSPIMVYYQPQYDDSNNCIGAEALLRWEHKRCGLVYPPLSIKIARESGDLFVLESFIIERSIADAERLREHFGEKFMMTVNVTVSTFCDDRFVPLLQTLAERYRLKTGNICIEIKDEPELVTTKKIDVLIRKIRAFGFIFSLDGFSLGQSSIQYLQNNPFDIVKLDGELVSSILENDRTREILNSIVQMAKSLDCRVIGEYVETEDQKKVLEQIGCFIYQGYLFSPAVDIDSFMSLRLKGNGESNE